MASQPKYFPNYTVDDYLLWDGDWELIDGIAIAMSPAPVVKHQLVAGRLITQLSSAISNKSSCNCNVVHESDWHVNSTSVLRPDIAVLCDGIPDRFIDYPPSLIVEVLSPSTRDRDEGIKRQIYQREGVKHYWQVDWESKNVLCLMLKNEEYEKIGAEKGSFQFELHESCGIEIDFEGIFEF